MKKAINLALLYAIVAICGGVFFREFTKLSGFVGVTKLSLVHTHFFMLGMMVMLLVALFCKALPQLATGKKYKRFMLLYNIGLPMTGLMLFVRGLLQVLIPAGFSKGLEASISGIAGLGHIVLGIGLIFLLLALRENAPE